MATNERWYFIVLPCYTALSARAARQPRSAILYAVPTLLRRGLTTWFSPQLVMGAIKPDTPFTWLLLLCQGLLGRADERRIEYEMRHMSISAVAVLFGLRRRRPGW